MNCMTLLAIVALCVAVYISVNRPLSLLYRVFRSEEAMRNIATAANSIRYQAAVEFIRSLETQYVRRPIGTTRFEDKPELVIAIVTMARKDSIGMGYLSQTVASVEKVIQDDTFFRRKLLFICNVDKKPGNHVEAIKLQKKFHYAKKYGGNSLAVLTYNKQKMFHTDLVDTARIREIEDYVFCLNVSHSLSKQYVMVLEDDVIPYTDLLEVVRFTLNNKLSNSSNRLLKKRKPVFSFLKLYYPLKWQGYAFEVDKLLELCGLASVLGAFIAGFFTVFKTNRRGNNSVSFSRIYFHGIILSSLISLLIGRVNLDGWRRLSPQLYKLESSPASCTQAMFYDRTFIPWLMNHLLVNNSLNKDLAIDKFSKRYDLPGYEIEPNLFLHTGLTSSLTAELKDPEEFLFDLS